MLSVLLPGALAATMVLVRSAVVPLWRDEYATQMHSSLPLPDLLRAVSTGDGVQAPYYVLMHALSNITGFGYGMRILSVIAVVAATCVIAVIALRWWGRAAGVVAGVFFAINGSVVTAGATARPYALLLLAIVVAILAGDLAARSNRWWPVYACAAALAVAMHVLAIIPVVMIGLLTLGRGRAYLIRWAWWTCVPAAVAAVVGFVGWTQREQIGSLGRPGVRTAVATVAEATGVSVRAAVTFDGIALILLGVVVVVFLVDVRRLPRPARSAAVRPIALAVGIAFVGPAVLFVWSLFFTSLFNGRYFVWAAIGSALLLGAAAALVVRGGVTWIRVAGGAVLALLAAVNVVAVTQPVPRFDDIPAVAAAIREHAAVGDVIYVFEHNPHWAIGYAVGDALGDERLAAAMSRAAVLGEQGPAIRTIDRTTPVGTVEGLSGTIDGGSVFFVGLSVPRDADLAVVARDLGCAPAGQEIELEGGGMQVIAVRCRVAQGAAEPGS